MIDAGIGANSASGGYDIDNSLKVEADNSEYAEYRLTSTTDRRNFCFSGWVKRTELVNATDGGQLIFASFTEGNEGVLLRWSRENSNYYDGIQVDIGQGGTNYRSYTSSLYRDTSAWYHIVLAVNTRENTASNRWKLYVNGEQVTSWAQQQFPTADFLTSANLSGSKHTIGAYESGGTVYGKNCGYFADFHFIDADQGNVTFLPTDFGEYDEDSGIWKPKEYEGSYGTNGFYLDFSDAANLGDDASGNGNNFTENNITSADQATDTPTNNFCTLVGNQQFVPSKSTTLVREGGTIMHGGQNGGAYSTMGVRSGKWYFESTLLHLGGVGGENHSFGVIAADRLYEMNILGEDIGADVGGWACAGNANPRNNNSGASGANYLTAPGINVVLGCALDMDKGKIWWHNAGTWHSLNSTVGNPANGTSPAWSNLLTATDDFVLPVAGLYANGAGPERAMNFGGYALPAFTAVGTYSDANGYGSFAYAPPSGYYALCTKNLARFG
jgi:hypothetical protein